MTKFNCPASQTLWESISIKGVERKLTSNKERTKYYLYELQNGRWNKIKENSNPIKMKRFEVENEDRNN